MFSGEMSPGVHVLTFQVRCEDSVFVTYTYEVHIRGNERPECRIASPLDGQIYTAGRPIAFIGDNWDPDDDVLLQLWSSDRDGGLFEGDEWAMAFFTPGEHVIRVNVSDDFGDTCTDSVSIWIENEG
jgi:hypothetical protein